MTEGRRRRNVHTDRALVASFGDIKYDFVPTRKGGKRPGKEQEEDDTAKPKMERESVTELDMTDFTSANFNADEGDSADDNSALVVETTLEEQQRRAEEDRVLQLESSEEFTPSSKDNIKKKEEKKATAPPAEQDEEDKAFEEATQKRRRQRPKPRGKSTTDHVHQDEHDELMQFAKECQGVAVEQQSQTEYSSNSLKDIPLAERQAARRARLEAAKQRIAAKKAAEEQKQ